MADARVTADSCRDCGTGDGLGWWLGRMKHPGAASARCHPCYLEYTRRRQTPAERRRPVRTSPFPRCLSCRQTVKASDGRCRKCHPLVCVHCGSPCHPGAVTPSCPQCSAESRSIAERRRREAERSGDRGITWRSVGKRDGWTCHLCGDPVIDSAGTAHNPEGATVDHLTPIALGGSHTWSNVALAHRSCNVLRGARPLAA